MTHRLHSPMMQIEMSETDASHESDTRRTENAGQTGRCQIRRYTRAVHHALHLTHLTLNLSCPRLRTRRSSARRADSVRGPFASSQASRWLQEQVLMYVQLFWV